MSHCSTGTYTSIFIVAALTVTSSDAMQQPYVINNNLSTNPIHEICENSKASGLPTVLYNNILGTSTHYISTDLESIKMQQQRHKAIEDSFSKYSCGFPTDKMQYFSHLSNLLCRIKFVDNISSYNEDDFSIDIILKLSNGLKLSISQFLDEDINAPVVFSIHRERTLLVSDEMPIIEIVNNINSLEANL